MKPDMLRDIETLIIDSGTDSESSCEIEHVIGPRESTDLLVRFYGEGELWQQTVVCFGYYEETIGGPEVLQVHNLSNQLNADFGVALAQGGDLSAWNTALRTGTRIAGSFIEATLPIGYP